MDFLNEYAVPVIIGICLCIGYVIKQWIKDVQNKYIPTLLAFLGVFLSIWINGNISPQVLLSGLVSGLASTGLHQAFKQFVENK